MVTSPASFFMAASAGQADFDPTLIGNSIWLDGSADTLEKTFSSGSAQTKVVISTWVQRYSFGSDQTIFSATGGTGGSSRSNRLSFKSDDTFDIHIETSTLKTITYSTTAVFRDIGFYHILVSIDQGQTQGPAQVKLFVNGNEVTIAATDIDQGFSASLSSWGNACKHNIGCHNGASQFFKGSITQTTMLVGQSIQSGDVSVSDFLDTFTFGTNGSQFIPKKDSDIAALATTAGGNSFSLDFSSASVALSSGVTPTSNAGTFSGSLSNLTDGDFTTEWRSTVDPATNVDNDHVAFDLGSAKDVKAVKITGRSSITGNFKVQFSDNGSDFTDTGTTFSNVSITSTANSGILDLTSDNPGSHRYWKLINISNSSGTSAWGFKEVILASVVGNLGTDASGNDNDFTLTSIDSVNQTVHTPSLQFPVLNVLNGDSSLVAALGYGNRLAVGVSSWDSVFATKSMGSSGKYYYEVRMHTETGSNGFIAGIHEESTTSKNWANYIGNTTSTYGLGYALYSAINGFYTNGSPTAISGYTSNIAAGDIVMMAVDLDNNKLYWGVNGTFFNSGDPANGTGESVAIQADTEYVFGLSTSSSEDYFVNFGQDSTFGGLTTAGGNTDANGVGDFKYTVPTGFQCLASSSLTAPDYQGIDYFDATLYEGNGQNQRVGDFVPFTDAYTVDKSAMFDIAQQNRLTRDTVTPTDADRFTLSSWLKLSNGSSRIQIFYSGIAGSPYTSDGSSGVILEIPASGDAFAQVNSGTVVQFPRPDIQSEWFHYLVSYEESPPGGGGTGNINKIEVYINGVKQTLSLAGATSNVTTPSWNSSGRTFVIGAGQRSPAQYYSGYVAETVFIDGGSIQNSDVSISNFGSVDTSTNRWVPVNILGQSFTFGNNGFYLEYEGDFSSVSLGNDAGKDSSGEGHHFVQGSFNSAWTAANQFTDTPSQNFDNLGGAQVGGTISEGNTKAALGTGGNQIRSNFNLSSGKWYVESDIQATNDSASIGLVPSRSATFSNGPGRDANGGISYETDGDVFSDNVQNATAEASFAAGDVVQMAIDMDAKKVYFGKNNTFGGDPAAGTGGHFLPASILSDGAALITLGNYSGSQSSTQQINYGQFLNFDGGSTTNGFKYTPPTGFKAVNQDNLDDTASKITAWAWIKNQDAADNHMLFDRVRGVGEDLQLFASSTVAEATDANTLQRFLQRGAQVGNDAKVNTANESYVLWQWLLGDSATTGSSNDSGSINSTVIAADAGHFSVGTFTGAGGSSTIGHGLSAAPEFFLVKRIGTSGSGWFVYSKSTTDPNNKFLRLQGTNAEDSASGAWTPGATTMGLNESSLNGINTSGVEHLFIAFRSVPGVCKVGSFIGNFDHDGPYISLGFKPSWYMTKDITTTSSWYIYDSANYPFNSTSVFHTLANTNDAGGAGAFNEQDFLSDGVKNRGQNNDTNASGSTFLYLAMAEIGGNGTLPPIYGR